MAADEAAVELLLRRLAATSGAHHGQSVVVRRGVNDDGVRGLFAARGIGSGETVLQVPLALAIVDDPRARERASARTTEEVEAESWSRQLCRALVRLRRRVESNAKSSSDDDDDDVSLLYYATLPRRVAGLANDDACGAVLADAWDCAAATADLRRHRAWLRTSFEAEREREKKRNETHDDEMSSTLTESDWRWAASMVHSRVFRLEHDDDAGGQGGGRDARRRTIRALVPGVDLLNHTSNPDEVNAEWRHNDTHFVVRTTRDVAVDEELVITYGNQCDRHFVLHHGFVPAHNPNNAVQLWVGNCRLFPPPPPPRLRGTP